jgi:hypothetical protein
MSGEKNAFSPPLFACPAQAKLFCKFPQARNEGLIAAPCASISVKQLIGGKTVARCRETALARRCAKQRKGMPEANRRGERRRTRIFGKNSAQAAQSAQLRKRQ